MSNVNRPRTGFKPCAFCASKERASNGQCACRNTLYRLTKAATSDSMAKKVKVLYNATVPTGGIVGAVAKVREEYPSLARTKTAPTKKQTKKTAAKKTAAPKVKVDVEKAVEIIEAAVAKAASKTTPDRYILNILDDFTDPKAYARKDAAIKNGVRSDEPWNVTFKGKIVAASDDLL